MNAIQYTAFCDELEKIAKSTPTLSTSSRSTSTTSRVLKNLTKNILLNLGVQIPVGKGASQRKPYFMGGIGGRW